MKKLIAFLSFCLVSCKDVEVRRDPYPASFDTLNHALLIEFRGSLESTVGCSLDSTVSTEAEPYKVYAPFKGELFVHGCGVDQKFVLDKPGPFSFKLPNIIPVGRPGFCILDIQYNFRVENAQFRTIRGRVYAERRGEGEGASEIYGRFDRKAIGTSTVKIREGFEGTIQTMKIRTSKPTPRGYAQLFGCNAGFKQKEFQGQEIEFDLSDLVQKPSSKSECFLFGFAVGEDGLNDTFSLGLTVFSKDDVRVGAHAFIEKNKVCFIADKYVSLVTYGEQWSNKLEGCFKRTSENVISFYSSQGRGLHGVIGGSEGVQWKD
jgi:hypothetical protein